MINNTITYSQLTPEELENYRQLPKPKKYGDVEILATQNFSRPSFISTSKTQPNGGNRPATR